MQNYFIFKNIDSRDVQGLIVSELPPITKPKMRVRIDTIDGKDGNETTELGYEAYTKTIKIGLTKGYNIDNIIAWLNGSGDIQFSNEPDKFYKIKILEQVDYEKLIRYKIANVKMQVQPFKFSVTERMRTFNVSGTNSIEIINSGNYFSKPTMTIYGTGTINLYINGVQICVLDMSNDANITLNSERQEAYSGAVLKNRKMDGKFPVLQAGRNTISWTGTITKIEFEKFSRWL